jgi:hypothetical protein
MVYISFLLSCRFLSTANLSTDGAYGFFGCINLAHGIVEPGLTMVPPVKNADTFTFFAMGKRSVRILSFPS